jgi:hypothetical protein
MQAFIKALKIHTIVIIIDKIAISAKMPANSFAQKWNILNFTTNVYYQFLQLQTFAAINTLPKKMSEQNLKKAHQESIPEECDARKAK